MSTMRNVLAIGLAGVGGWIVYKSFFAEDGESILPTTVDNTPDVTAPSTIETPTTQTVQGTTYQVPYMSPAILRELAGVQMLTPDQWHYYYQQKAGFQLPIELTDKAFGWVGTATRNKLYTAEEWINGLVSAGARGLTGLGVYDNGGLGLAGFRGISMDSPTGYERAIKFWG